MLQKTELTIDIRIKTIVHHDKDDNLEDLCKMTFNEITAISSVPAENWEMLGYKTERIIEQDEKVE